VASDGGDPIWEAGAASNDDDLVLVDVQEARTDPGESGGGRAERRVESGGREEDVQRSEESGRRTGRWPTGGEPPGFDPRVTVGQQGRWRWGGREMQGERRVGFGWGGWTTRWDGESCNG
jgi:hypothetical protein